jgi:hypothetical protein
VWNGLYVDYVDQYQRSTIFGIRLIKTDKKNNKINRLYNTFNKNIMDTNAYFSMILTISFRITASHTDVIWHTHTYINIYERTNVRMCLHGKSVLILLLLLKQYRIMYHDKVSDSILNGIVKLNTLCSNFIVAEISF